MNKKLIPIFTAAAVVATVCSAPLSANAASVKKKATVTISSLNVRAKASNSAKIVGVLKKNTTVTVVKLTKTKWVGIKYKKKLAYISKRYLKFKKTSSTTKTTKKKPTVNSQSVSKNDTNYTWAGAKLTKHAGVIIGPSGKETYYNLNMSRVVKNMNMRGFSGKYRVRKDGVKMFGDYVMVAANLDIRPFGTHVKTSLGMGIVVDTGSFAYQNQTQLDIAVNW